MEDDTKKSEEAVRVDRTGVLEVVDHDLLDAVVGGSAEAEDGTPDILEACSVSEPK